MDGNWRVDRERYTPRLILVLMELPALVHKFTTNNNADAVRPSLLSMKRKDWLARSLTPPFLFG